VKPKQKRIRLNSDEDRKLKRLAEENGLSEAQVFRMLLHERDRETVNLTPAQKELQAEIDQLEARKAMLAPAQNKELYQSNWRARGARSVRHLENKPTEETEKQERKRAKAKSLLEAGHSLYDVEAATGLSRLEVTQLERERRAENEAGTRAALDDMAHRVSLVETAPDEDGEPEQQYSSLRELNTSAISRLFY